MTSGAAAESHDPVRLAFRVEVHERLDSTQDEARRRLERGDDVHGVVLRAREQTAARGQRRRDWWGGRGGSWQTVVVRDTRPAVLDRPWAALAIGIGLARTLPEYGVQIQLKWPNDLHYRGRKVGGLLVERVRDHLLIGVGVNVENEAPAGAGALRGLDPDGVSTFVLAGVQAGIALVADGLEDGRALPAAFAPHDALDGRPVRIATGVQVVEGVCAGVDPRGRLRVRREGGMVTLVDGDAASRGRLRFD